MSQISERPARADSPNRIARMLQGWGIRSARVSAVEQLTPRFRIVTFAGDALRNAAWTAGQKVQIPIGSGLNSRTYTPMSWSADGKMQLLIFTHGGGPGSRLASDLREGDSCQLFGPRNSLDLSRLASPMVLFGDETSFGLAAALRNSPQGVGAVHVFEVSDVAECRSVLEAIDLGQATLIERSATDVHLGAAEIEVLRLAASGANFALTGKASSIQRVYKALKAAGVASSQVKTKAYWAQGKTGLD